MASHRPGSFPLSFRHRVLSPLGTVAILSVFLGLMSSCTLFPVDTEPRPVDQRPSTATERPSPPRPETPPAPQSSAWSYAGHEVIARARAEGVRALRFTPDGRYLVVLGRDVTSATLTFFDVGSDLTPVCTLRPDAYRDPSMAFAVSPDSRLVAYGNRDGRVALITVGRDCSVLAEYQASNQAIRGLDFSVDGSWVYAATLRTVYRLPATPGSAAPVSADIGGGFGNQINMLAAGRDRLYTVASGGEGQWLHYRSLEGPDFGQVLDFVRFTGPARSLAAGEVSPSRLQVVAVVGQGFIFVEWRGQESGNVMIPAPHPSPGEVHLTADGTALVTVLAFGTVQVWDYRAQAVSFTYASGVMHAAPSPDNKHLALATTGGDLLLTGQSR